MRRRLGLPFAILAGLAASPFAGAQVSSRVVAYSGMPAPGTSPSAVFDNFNYPAIAPQGEIVFRGRLVAGSNTYGLWRETFDQATQAPILKLVQREGTASPVAGFNFAGFSGPPTINLPGHLAFKAHIQSGSTFNDTLWVEKPAPAGLALVAREGQPAPGVPGANFGAIFVHAGYDPLLIDGSGRALFVGRLTGGSVTAANDVGLWFYDGTTVSLVAREGDQMPGVPAGHFFIDNFQTTNFVLLGNGVYVFYGSDGDPTAPLSGLWSNHSGTVQPLILQGGSAPGLAADETLTLIGGFRINHFNQVAFGGIVKKDDKINPVSFLKGVWISDSQGGFFLSARSEQAPDGRVPDVRVLSDGGHAFGVDDLGRLCRVTWGGLSIIAKPNQPAPGTAAGVAFSSIDVNAIAASAAGQVAFLAQVAGTGVTIANDRGLWFQDENFELRLVAREGGSIEAPAGSPRTIAGLEFALGVGSGGPRAMSDRGEVLWKAQVAGLPNGSQVIAVTGVGSPPAPPELMALEVVQVIQNWRNEIDLVAGKKTIVRAHLKSAQGRRLAAQLRAFRNGAGGGELPVSPLDPDNPGGYINIDSTSDQKRDRLNAGLYFTLPEAWTTGTVTLSLDSSVPLICREAALPVGNDCRATVTFQPVELPKVRFLGVSWLDDQFTAHHSSFDQAADVAHRALLALPTKEVLWGYRQSGLLIPQLPSVVETLPLIKFLHAADGSPKRLYYGIISSEKTVGILGIAYVTGWAGVGHVPSNPQTVPGRHTHTHELAHELSRSHSVHSTVAGTPAGKKIGSCGEEAPDTTPNFPNWFNVNGQMRPTLGKMDQGANKLVFGLDTDLMKVADPTKVFDLMSYCRDATFEYWPSDWTYSHLASEINSRFYAPGPVAAGTLAADSFIVRGSVHRQDNTVELLPFATLVQTEPPVPPAAGDYLLRLRSGAGTLLTEIAFEPDLTEPLGPDPGLGPFLIGVPTDPAIRKVEIVHGGQIVASRAASAHAPTVAVTAPNGGENFTGSTVNLQWTGNDADGDPLTYVVQYSPDNGASWETLGADLTSTSVSIPRSSLPASSQGLLRVHASDGFLTAFDTSNGTFTVANNPPFVKITEPVSGRLFVGDQLVSLEAMSFDPEDGNLAKNRFGWSSSLDGSLGTDNGFSLKASGLSQGTHVITVTATDGNGAQATDTATIRIASEPRVL